MPIDQEGQRTYKIAEGLNDRPNPLLIDEGQAAVSKNVHFNRLSVEEAGGARRIHPDRARHGGVRFRPLVKRDSVQDMTGWRDGYAFAPCTWNLTPDPEQIDVSFRINEEAIYPMSGEGIGARYYGGLSGRDEEEVAGDRLLGGEHQFFPLLARGARELESPQWGLGVGIYRPVGYSPVAPVVFDGEPDAIRPIFYWWDPQDETLKVSVADMYVFPRRDYHLTVRFVATQGWYVNGSLVATLAGSDALPASLLQAYRYPVYMGRCYTREPDISYARVDRVAAFMGRMNLTASAGTAGATINLFSQQLAFVGATAQSFVGYRLRTRTGANPGRIYPIASTVTPTVDATFAVVVTAAAPGIAPGDTVDLIPPVEPKSADVTVQEARLWKNAPADALLPQLAGRQLFTEQKDTGALTNLLRDLGGTPIDLIAYWPMNEDGGITLKEIAGGSDAYFAPGYVSVQENAQSSQSGRMLWLDGESASVQCRLDQDPNFKKNYAFNLGKDADGFQHFNLAVKMEFMLGSENVDLIAVGNIEDNPYRVLFSIGEVGGRTVLEARATRFAGVNQIYFLLPDGNFRTITPLTNVDVGLVYNALFGIEALLDDPIANPNRHYVYFHAVDGGMVPAGAFGGPFNLQDVTLDPDTDYVISFGASVNGTATLGSRDHNHELLGISVVGYGFHPAHLNPGASVNNIIPLVQMDPIRLREEGVPLALGQGGSASLASGSRLIPTTSSLQVPSFLRRWPVEVNGADLLYKEEDQPTDIVPDHILIETVSGTTLTLVSPFIGRDVTGASLRVVLWTGFTDFRTQDPPWDTDVNAGLEEGEPWALTPDVFLDLMSSQAGFEFALAPLYENVSPFAAGPSWDRGLIEKRDVEVSGVYEYAKSDGYRRIIAVAGGTISEVDDRWREGSLDDEDHGRSFELRRINPLEARRLERDNFASQLFSAASQPLPDEAVLVPGDVFIDPDEPDAVYTWEIDVWLDALDGRRTLASLAELTVGDDSLSVNRWLWAKNHHWYLENGAMTFEIRNDAIVGGHIFRATTYLLSGSGLREKRWHRFAVRVEIAAGVISDVTFWVDGRISGKTVSASSLAVTDIPVPDGQEMVGAIGSMSGVALGEGLGGRISGFRFVLGDPFGTADYDPQTIDGEADTYDGTVVEVPFTESRGVSFVTNLELNAIFQGFGLVHRFSGIGDSSGREVAFEFFTDVLYISNNVTRPWRLTEDEVTAVGLRAPPTKLKSAQIVRGPLRVKDEGSDDPPVVGTGLTSLVVASPNLATFAASTPRPTQRDVGALVWIPSDTDMGAAADDPMDYIGVVSAFTSTPNYTTLPAPFTQQARAAADLAWTLFRKVISSAPSNVAYKALIQLMKSTTPWGDRRLIAQGRDDNRTPREEDLVTPGVNESCLHLRGNTFVELQHYDDPVGDVATGMVLSVKAYIRLDDIDTYGEDGQVIFEKAVNDQSASYRVMVVSGGRLRFEFFDTSIAAFRSIETVGKVVSAKQWYYLHLRYRFKDAGSCAHDTEGGWEPDLRWSWKSNVAGQVQKVNDFRDGLWIYACEGYHQKGTNIVHADPAAPYDGDVDECAPCPLLTLPGAHSQCNGAAGAGPLTHNHSQQLCNTGLLLNRPFLTPERGDVWFPAAAAPAGLDSGIELRILANNFQALVGGIVAGNAQFVQAFCLPRSLSMNRDDAWNRQADQSFSSSSQIYYAPSQPAAFRYNFFNDVTAPAPANVTATPNLANPGIGAGDVYGKQEAWAVIVRVWTVATSAVAPPGTSVDVAPGDPARILALVHLGTNDLGVSARGGVSGHTMFLTDDVIYGGDGLGPITVGAVPLNPNDTVVATFEFPNGQNQSVLSTNRLVTPSLLVQGDNPVGVADAPDTSKAPTRIGGTVDQGQEGRAKNGLRGRIEDFGFLLAELVESGTDIYTPDHLAVESFFTGPADTRFQSLPRLHFAYNPQAQDDISGLWGGQSAQSATGTFRFDELSGKVIRKDASTSIVPLPTGEVVRDGDTYLAPGLHRVRVTYYDPKQNRESNPGPEALIRVEGSSAGDELDAGSAIQVRGVPVSGDGREALWRRIYKSFPGGATLFLWETLTDNSTVAVTPRVSRYQLAAALPIDFQRQRPPICRAMKASETNMYYGGIDDAPNVTVVSQAFIPEHVRGTQIVFTESGKGGGVVGLGYLQGKVVPAKEDAVFVVTPSEAGFRVSRIADSVGALSHNGFAQHDGVLYFPGQKGVYVLAGNQQTYLVSGVIERLYREGIDIRRMSRCHAVSYAHRGQFVLTIVPEGEEDPTQALTMEMRWDQFGNRYYVWSVLDLGVPLFSASQFKDRFSRVSRIALGGRGFVYALDEGTGIGAFEEGRLDGPLQGTLVSSTSRSTFRVSAFDPTLTAYMTSEIEGFPFVVLREYAADGNQVPFGTGVSQEVVASGQILDASIPVSGTFELVTDQDVDWQLYHGDRVVIGGKDWEWRSKWWDLGTGETVKQWQYIDVAWEPVSGDAFFDVFCDFGTEVAWSMRVPLKLGYYSVPIKGLNSRYLQFRVKGAGLAGGFKMHQITLRAKPAEWGRRQQVT